MRILVIFAICLACAMPASAQLNNQKILQNANDKIKNAGEQQKNTQQQVDANVAPAISHAQGTVVSVQNDLVTVNQSVTVDGKSMTVKNKFYLQPTTKRADNWKLAPAAKVKIQFQVGQDGRRMVTQIGP